MPTTAPCSAGAEGERGQRDPPPHRPFLVLTAPGRGLAGWSCIGSEGALCWAATNRFGLRPRFPVVGRPVQRPVACCWLRIQTFRLSPKPGWMAELRRGSPTTQAWSDQCAGGTADAAGPGEGYRSQRCCDRALLGLLKSENDRETSPKVSLIRLGPLIHRAFRVSRPQYGSLHPLSIRVFHHRPSSASAAASNHAAENGYCAFRPSKRQTIWNRCSSSIHWRRATKPTAPSSCRPPAAPRSVRRRELSSPPDSGQAVGNLIPASGVMHQDHGNSPATCFGWLAATASLGDDGTARWKPTPKTSGQATTTNALAVTREVSGCGPCHRALSVGRRTGLPWLYGKPGKGEAEDGPRL